jgi:hypothetical protein
MSDALFRYLLMARERDQSWRRRLLLSDDERLLAAGFVRLTETVALRVEYAVQSMREKTQPSNTIPASAVDKVIFYEQPVRDPPPKGVLRSSIDIYPIRSTLKIEPCPWCMARGWVHCNTCLGTRRVICPRCQGKSSWHRCERCGNSRVVECSDCDQDGHVVDGLCFGEGRVASWRESIIHYTIERITESFVPPGIPANVVRAADEALKTPGITVAPFTEAGTVAALGYSTPETAVVLVPALHRPAAIKLARDAAPADCLHIVSTASVIPLSSCRVLSESRRTDAEYWLVGRGDAAVEIPPRTASDRWKLGTLPGFVLSIGSLSEAAALHGAPGHIIALLGFAGLGAIGLATSAIGLRRILFGGRRRVRTIAVLPCSGVGTPYLTCLGAVGSFTGALTVLDHTYGGDLRTLMEDGQEISHSQTVAVRSKSGDYVRLIELARFDTLTGSERARMAAAVDGIIYLARPDETADRLRELLRSASAHPPDTLLRLDLVADQCDRSGQTPQGGLALSVVRRAFTRRSDGDLDWSSVFTSLWQPVAELLR